MVQALDRARPLASPTDVRLIDHVLAMHTDYLGAIDRMFDAIDAGNVALTNRIDSDKADPVFSKMELLILAAAANARRRSAAQLDALATLETRVLVATPLVFAFGLGLVVFFWIVLRRYETQVRDAAAHEAALVRRSEKRFRAMIQHASDVVLIATASGAITYQSPATETSWGYAPKELRDRSLAELIHPDDVAAARDVWGQALATAGAIRTTELRLRDKPGTWHCFEQTLTNLLHEPAVAGMVINLRNIDERKTFEQQLAQQAFYDSLTGLPNRALFQDRLRQALVRSGRRQNSIALLFLDLDNFKLVNDSLGHQAGDLLLVEAGKRLRASVRAGDTVARLGGDEFVVLLEHISGEADTLPVVEAIRQQLVRPFMVGQRTLVVSASIGIALGATQQDQAEALLRNADVAMYRAKARGKGQYAVFDPRMHADTVARMELEADLRQALERGEFRVRYQPVVALPTGRIREVEALVRWQHPTRGMISPADFIPIAEETGLIVPIGRWVLQEACRQAASWQAACPRDPPLILGVNLSPRQLQMPDLAAEVSQILRESGLPAGCLKLEITEGVLMQDMEATIAVLWQLKSLGSQLAVDDFGTGYSSLAYLKRLPLDVLKIDRSFVTGIGRQPEDQAIVRAIISLAKTLGLSLTAEGVETAEQAAALNAWGCECGQGYHFARPLGPSEIQALLDRPNTPVQASHAA